MHSSCGMLMWDSEFGPLPARLNDFHLCPLLSPRLVGELSLVQVAT